MFQEPPAPTPKTPVKRQVAEELGSQDRKNIKKFRLSANRPHHVMEAYLQELRARGKYREVSVIQEMDNDDQLATEILAFVKARKNGGDVKVDPLDALALLFKEDFSVKNYDVSQRFQYNRNHSRVIF